MKIHTLIAGVSLSWVLLQASDTGLTHLNTLRAEAGLHPLSVDYALTSSAEAHSHYLALNHTTGHTEESYLDGFTGEGSSDRAIAAGYESIAVSENVSWGQESIQSSIDKLLSGIYHRFTFLSMEKDIIGIGVEDRHYTFDLGNRALNQLCLDHLYSSGAYYYNACRDSQKRIEIASYNQARDYYKLLNDAPEAVVWPAPNSHDILPGFYAESPDPLPDYGVSGYPVSVTFNDARFPTAPDAVSLMLQDEDNHSIESLFMDTSTDPNQHFSSHQFALFPLEHLEWGRTYQVTLTYESEEKHWCFSTRSLASFGAEKVYRIDHSEDSRLEVVAGKSYALYLVPQHQDDLFSSYHYRYNTDRPSIGFIDRNTLLVTVEGEAGERVEISLDNETEQIITLVIADSDQAVIPSADICSDTPSASLFQSDATGVSTDGNESYSMTDSIETSADSSSDTGEEVTSSSGGGFPLLMLWAMVLLALLYLKGSQQAETTEYPLS